jgi:hypothetical protein
MTIVDIPRPNLSICDTPVEKSEPQRFYVCV